MGFTGSILCGRIRAGLAILDYCDTGTGEVIFHPANSRNSAVVYNFCNSLKGVIVKKIVHMFFALGLLFASSAYAATDVVVYGEDLGATKGRIDHFYDNLAGHSSNLVASGVQLNTVNLTGIKLLWATQPADSYTAAELNTMSSFLAGGGRIAFMGEHGSFAPNENNRINAALSFLGASISINNVIHDSGFRTASVGDGQILAHALTTGVNTYQYAAYAPLTISGSAQALMIGENQPSVMMAYQNIGPGSIFLITDQNVWDNEPSNWGNTFDNGRMFENLLSGTTGAPPPPPIPEPETYALMLAGLGLLGFVARRRKQQAA